MKQQSGKKSLYQLSQERRAPDKKITMLHDENTQQSSWELPKYDKDQK